MFKKDYAHCTGELCRRKEKCCRYKAHLEAVKHKKENVVYNDPSVCMSMYFFLFVECEEERYEISLRNIAH